MDSTSMTDVAPGIQLADVFCSSRYSDVEEPYKVQKFAKGEFVYKVNEEINQVYLVKSGRVKLGRVSESGREVTKGIFGEERMFGEFALFDETPCSMEYAMAFDDLEVFVLSLEWTRKRMEEDSCLTLKISNILNSKLRMAEQRIESLMLDDSRTRIIEFLRRLGVEQGKKVGFETLVQGFYTHQEIAQWCATSRQTVTTVLNELRDQNQITFDRRRLLIRDLENLG